jgi:hypothetical protein
MPPTIESAAIHRDAVNTVGLMAMFRCLALFEYGTVAGARTRAR